MSAKAPPLLPILDELTAAVRARSAPTPAVGVILGSGLGGFADTLQDRVSIPYGELPHFPVSGVAGHAGRLVLGKLDGVHVVAMQGRVHFYEGFEPWQVALPARLLCRLGIKGLVVTNAAGGIRTGFQPGDLMRITDHLNLSGMNPLMGHNEESLGPRFPDMSHAYDPRLAALLEAAALDARVTLQSGVYAQLSGPTYETPAEIRMLRTLGADAVGMSTVPEVVVASHMGVPVAGISCITNLAAGISPTKLSHAEVSETADRVKDRFVALLAAFLPRIAR
jgi:purine-nucleoside phosphorylase